MAIPALAILQAGGQIASAVGQASAIKMQGKWQSGQYDRNAELMDFQAKEAARIGEKEAQQKAGQVKRTIGRQRAIAAAQGIEVSDGSALEIQQDTAGLGALDVVTIRNNAWKQAWGYKVEASNLRANAEFTRINAKYTARQTLITGGMNAATSIMGGMKPSGNGNTTGDNK